MPLTQDTRCSESHGRSLLQQERLPRGKGTKTWQRKMAALRERRQREREEAGLSSCHRDRRVLQRKRETEREQKLGRHRRRITLLWPDR